MNKLTTKLIVSTLAGLMASSAVASSTGYQFLIEVPSLQSIHQVNSEITGQSMVAVMMSPMVVGQSELADFTSTTTGGDADLQKIKKAKYVTWTYGPSYININYLTNSSTGVVGTLHLTTPTIDSLFRNQNYNFCFKKDGKVMDADEFLAQQCKLDGKSESVDQGVPLTKEGLTITCNCVSQQEGIPQTGESRQYS